MRKHIDCRSMLPVSCRFETTSEVVYSSLEESILETQRALLWALDWEVEDQLLPTREPIRYRKAKGKGLPKCWFGGKDRPDRSWKANRRSQYR